MLKVIFVLIGEIKIYHPILQYKAVPRDFCLKLKFSETARMNLVYFS